MKPVTLDTIKVTTDKHKLLTLAWMVQGTIHSGAITPKHYADCMMELSRKLGFPITVESLKRETTKYKEGELRLTKEMIEEIAEKAGVTIATAEAVLDAYYKVRYTPVKKVNK